MTKQLWINLPVKDVARSREFFSHLGFTFNDAHGVNPTCMLVGEMKFVVMLFEEGVFKSFTRQELSDTTLSTEVLFSIDAESRAEVDALAAKAKEAGGIVFAEPGESQGWMYGCGFCDLDGHRWNVLYMDMSKMPK